MKNKNNISIISLGCSKNLVDSEFLVGGLEQERYNIVEDPDKSDIVIVNTCGFLDTAREEGVDVILKAAELKASNKIEKLLVMGCFSERFGSDLRKELPEVDQFFGTNDQSQIISYLTGKDYSSIDPDFQRSLLTPSHYAYLKITEGCDNGCTFCSIPLMRGLQKSQPIKWNVMEAKRLAANGVKELLVIGQDTTSYGWDLEQRSSLNDLLIELDSIKELDWIRLHYAHPSHIHRNLIKSYKNFDKVIPYIDMPVQHGADRILKKMRRGLNSYGIKKRIDMLRDSNPNIAIRTSIIVGYPGESDSDFKLLSEFIDEVKFDRLGVFIYSEEEGTFAAINEKDNVPRKIKEERFDAIMRQQQMINLNKNKSLIHSKDRIIIDKSSSDECWSIGRSFRDSPEIDNYVKINSFVQEGEFCNVIYTEAHEYDLEAEIINE